MKTKIILAALLAFATFSALQAQVGEQRYNFALGVNGGINLNRVSFSPSVEQKNLMGINAGLTARYICEKYFSIPDVHYTRTMNYVEIPFLAHLAFGKDRGVQVFLNIGPQIGFLIGDSEKQSGDMEGMLESMPYVETEQHGKAIDNKFDYGITGGLGVELRTRAGNFLVEGRYYFGLADFYASTKKDYFARSANGTITAKITYLFDISK